MTVAMTYEPPLESAADRSAPAPVVDEAALVAFGMAEEAGLLQDVSVTLWDELPEEFCRDHELDRGRLIWRRSGTPGHQTAMRRLANAIEQAARSAVGEGLHECLTVNQDLDVRLWDVPGATVRRPDVVVHHCLKTGARLRAPSVLLVVEIVSPSSRATDTGQDNRRTGFESKMTQYALAGIEHYWIVWLKPDDSAIASIEQWRLQTDYRGGYVKTATWVNDEDVEAMQTEVPFSISLTWADLEF